MLLGITGATGFIGKKLVDIALNRGHEVVAFSRRPEKAIPGCEMRRFALEETPDISGCDAIIHLAGESVVGVWTAEKRRRIRESRVLGTRRLVEAILGSSTPPEVLVSGSAVGYYGDGGDAEITENTPPGSGFLAETVLAWEAEARKAAEKCRVVLLRTGLVLGREAGALAPMARVFRLSLGAQLGDGRQWMPWIHIEDEVRLLLFAVENMDVRGPLNATAPWPARNADFTRELGKVLRRPTLLRAPAFALRLMGEFSRELLDSKRVVPAAATAHGYGFRFSEIQPALKDLLG